MKNGINCNNLKKVKEMKEELPRWVVRLDKKIKQNAWKKTKKRLGLK
jgi:hypothetical protein